MLPLYEAYLPEPLTERWQRVLADKIFAARDRHQRVVMRVLRLKWRRAMAIPNLTKRQAVL
jgi:hypothetical protein